MSNGHGISDAVRLAISSWVTADLTDLLYAALPETYKSIKQAVFRARLQRPESWVRYNRTKESFGYKRRYHLKNSGIEDVVLLTVNTDSSDYRITFVTFSMNGQIIYGGKVDVPSVQLTGARRNVQIQADDRLTFTPFTREQLDRFRIELECGDAAVLGSIFTERVA